MEFVIIAFLAGVLFGLAYRRLVLNRNKKCCGGDCKQGNKNMNKWERREFKRKIKMIVTNRGIFRILDIRKRKAVNKDDTESSGQLTDDRSSSF